MEGDKDANGGRDREVLVLHFSKEVIQLQGYDITERHDVDCPKHLTSKYITCCTGNACLLDSFWAVWFSHSHFGFVILCLRVEKTYFRTGFHVTKRSCPAVYVNKQSALEGRYSSQTLM